MSTPPSLFDRPALTRHRDRATREALFLHEAALDEVEDRLQLVNRSFNSIGIVTPFPDLWRTVYPAARFISDSDVLDLETENHDLIVHAMCLHWANDPVGQIIQCRRALHPDGLFLGLMLGGNTLAELRVALAEAESRLTGGLSPRILPMAEIRDIGALLQRAGLSLPVVDSFDTTASYRDIWHLMTDLRAMGEVNALAQRRRSFTRRGVFELAQDIYAQHFADPETGRLPATFETLCLTGWAPDESQPQPLRPGSATTRLAEALGTTETPLRD
ncbi:MAG: SAM-dependent methyltransferase [Arenibacterium sp.]